jgi:hypothetical protein
MRNLKRGLPTTALLVAVLLACETQPPSDALFTVTDSLGIEIVENMLAPEFNAGGWSVNPDPLFTIGAEGEGGSYTFYDVRGARRLSDRRVVVANSGNSEILFFDGRGGFRTAVGGQGLGPGEFRAVSYVGRFGEDSLVVLDRGLRRISYFDADGGFLRSTPVDLNVGLALLPKGNLSDGRLLFGGGPTAESVGQLANGINRMPTRFAIAALDGSLDVTVAELPGAELYAANVEADLEMWHMPFAKTPAGGVWGDRVYIGTADRYEIQVWDIKGSLIRIILLDQESMPISPADIDSVLEEWISEDPESEEGLRRRYREIPPLDRMPAYGRFLTDSEGCLWVEEYRRSGDWVPTWTIFSHSGIVLSRVALPRDLEVLDVGLDYLLGVMPNELGLEVIGQYRLTRGADRDLCRRG